MHDVIQDLCSNLREFEMLLSRLRATSHNRPSVEVERVTRKIELCERWLLAAGGAAALRRQRAKLAAPR